MLINRILCTHVHVAVPSLGSLRPFLAVPTPVQNGLVELCLTVLRSQDAAVAVVDGEEGPPVISYNL